MEIDNKTVELIIKLLQQTTSLSVIRKFLKEKGLHYSATSWEDIVNKRIKPAIQSNQLDTEDLTLLLRDVEEYGHQHVFLYHCHIDASKLMAQDRIKSIMDKCGLEDVTAIPKILDQPQEPTITDIRWEYGASKFIIKIIETRQSYELIGEKEDGDILTKQWRKNTERAVNLFKLHNDGLLELRITSQRNSEKYKSEVEKMWFIVKDFLLKESFQEISLSKAKNQLWHERRSSQNKIRFSNSTLKNDFGNTIIAGAGSATCNLYEDQSVNDSMEVFIKHDAYCDSHRIWFKMGSVSTSDEDEESREIRVLLSGELNEFAITAHCSSQEYEHVLNQLRSFNK